MKIINLFKFCLIILTAVETIVIETAMINKYECPRYSCSTDTNVSYCAKKEIINNTSNKLSINSDIDNNSNHDKVLVSKRELSQEEYSNPTNYDVKVKSYIKYTLNSCSESTQQCLITKIKTIGEISCQSGKYNTKYELKSYPYQKCKYESLGNLAFPSNINNNRLNRVLKDNACNNNKTASEIFKFNSDINDNQDFSFACLEDFSCEKDGNCKGISHFNQCTISGTCPLGYTCLSYQTKSGSQKLCLPQLTEGEACEKDTDCMNNLGCHKDKLICTPYFSLQIGEKYDEEKNELNTYPLCNSGESINGYCDETELLTPTCTETNICKYKSVRTNEIIVNSKKCSCSYSPKGEKYCEKGSVDEYKKSYYKLLLELLISGSCHTTERRNCLKMFNNSYLNMGINDKLEFFKFKGFKEHLFTDADSCVKKTLYPTIKDSLSPNKSLNYCPIFVCSNNLGDSCIKKEIISDNKFQYTSASLNDYNNNIIEKEDYKSQNYNYEYTTETNRYRYSIQKCGDSESCIFDYSQLFAQDNNLDTVSCHNINSNTKTTNDNSKKDSSYKKLSYPGEPCLSNDNCMDAFICDSTKLCSGKSKDQTCETHSDCKAGLFCESNQTCQSQKYEDSYCRTEYDCRNNMGCHDNKCIKYFSLPTGTALSKSIVDINANNKLTDLCEFGYVDDQNQICSKLSYFTSKERSGSEFDKIKKDKKYDTKNKVIECELGEKCTLYNSNNIASEEYCTCGYNKLGKSYCPISHDDEKSWKQYLNQILINRNNDCHTLNRFKCQFVPKKFKDLENNFRMNSILKPFTTEAEECLLSEFFGVSSSHLYKNILYTAIICILISLL